MAEQKIIQAATDVPWPTLRVLAIAMQSDLGTYEKLVLQSFSVRWIVKLLVGGGYLCPTCGNLWTTAEKREQCDHAGNTPSFPETEAVIREWISLAEIDVAKGGR